MGIVGRSQRRVLRAYLPDLKGWTRASLFGGMAPGLIALRVQARFGAYAIAFGLAPMADPAPPPAAGQLLVISRCGQ